MPEARPGFGNKDTVARVAGVVAHLDGLVEAEADDAVGEARDILGAVVGDAGEAVTVDEDLGCGGDTVFAIEGEGVYDDAVADAAFGGDALTAAALYLFWGRGAPADNEPDQDAKDDSANDQRHDEAGIAVAEMLLKLVECVAHGGVVALVCYRITDSVGTGFDSGWVAIRIAQTGAMGVKARRRRGACRGSGDILGCDFYGAFDQ